MMDAHLIDPPRGTYTDDAARCVHCRMYKDEHHEVTDEDQTFFMCSGPFDQRTNYEFEPDDGEREPDPDARRDER